jgi:DNA repair exonuclease SbcCD ATPase subunit
MKLTFDRLDFENFMSFVGKHSLDFNEHGVGLHFLRGKNEKEPRLAANDAGKSTLWSAFLWCMTGRTTNALKGKDVHPWFGKGSTNVSLHFKTDKDNHVIERSDGIKLDGKIVDQARIDALLQMNHEVILHTILLGQGKPLFFDLEPRKKMELFSEVLDLDRWDERAKRASEKTTELSNKHLEKTGELRSVNMTLDGVIKNLVAVKEKATTWTDDQQATLEKERTELDKTRKLYKQVNDNRTKADLTYDGTMVEVKALRKEIEGYVAKMLELSKDADIVGMEVLKSERKKLMETLREFGEGDHCPTCGQTVKGTDFYKHKNKLVKQIGDLSDRIAPVHEKLTQTQKRFDEIKALMIKQQYYLKKLEEKAEEAEHIVRVSTTDEARLQALVHSLQASIDKALNEVSPYEEQLQQLRRQKTKLTARLKELDDEMTSIEARMERTKFWVKGFKDVRLYIIEEVIAELEMATNAILPEVGLDGWEVSYDIEKETKSGTIQRGLNVLIMSPSNRSPVPWAVWGGGVGQRLRLVSALALGEVLLNHASVTPNIEILDEPTRSLSAPGVRDLCEYLATRAETLGKQVWLIDHMARESSQFESVVTVVKDKKGSHIS